MAGYTGLRSCTWTEFPAYVFYNSSLLAQSHAESTCDLTLLTCVLIGSYRFCIIPLLAAFHGNVSGGAAHKPTPLKSVVLKARLISTPAKNSGSACRSATSTSKVSSSSAVSPHIKPNYGRPVGLTPGGTALLSAWPTLPTLSPLSVCILALLQHHHLPA
ncbi:hypothetical protein CHARACLAT_005511 [Characodon lateralis]|uniref:Uncharacterized protein n=1 Tax=Characodon lateralis TaxID=208331 RepID=A0ABU7D796_9TELE|nr:hypothetical protein [Characodon lateralis]